MPDEIEVLKKENKELKEKISKMETANAELFKTIKTLLKQYETLAHKIIEMRLEEMRKTTEIITME